jgi:hypothetical protein
MGHEGNGTSSAANYIRKNRCQNTVLMLCALYGVYFTLPSSIEVLYIRGAPCSTELTKLLTKITFFNKENSNLQSYGT